MNACSIYTSMFFNLQGIEREHGDFLILKDINSFFSVFSVSLVVFFSSTSSLLLRHLTSANTKKKHYPHLIRNLNKAKTA